MKVTIESTNLRKIVSRKNGEVFYSQDIRIQGDILAGPSSIFVDYDKPYPIGEYEIDLESCLSFGSFGRLEFRLSKLKPLRLESPSSKTSTIFGRA